MALEAVVPAFLKHLAPNLDDMLRFLLYPTGLGETDLARIQADDSGVIWL